MLSQKTKKYFIKSIRLNSILCATPYEWNGQLRRMQVTTSKSRLFLWHLVFLLEVLFELFIIFRLIQSTTGWHIPGIESNLNPTIAELTNMRYKAIIYMLPVAFQCATLVRWEQLPMFVNFYMRFYDFVADDAMDPKKKREGFKVKNSCDPVMPYIYYMGNILATLQSVSTFTRPQQITLFSSIMTNPKGRSILIRLPISLLHGFLVFTFCYKMQIHLFAVLSYTSPMALIVKELKIPSSTKDINGRKSLNSLPVSDSLLSNEIRSAEKFVLIYRCTEFLHRLFNDAFTRIELPCVKAVLMAAIILGLYGCVKIEDFRVLILIFVASASLLSLNSTTNSMAELYESSQAVLESWKPQLLSVHTIKLREMGNPINNEVHNNNQILNNGTNNTAYYNLHGNLVRGSRNALLTRCIKSFRPLTSRISNFYNVKKITVLVVMGFIAETTVNVLLTF